MVCGKSHWWFEKLFVYGCCFIEIATENATQTFVVFFAMTIIGWNVQVSDIPPYGISLRSTIL